MLEPIDQSHALIPASLVAIAGVLFSVINIQNANAFDPQWSQDLAFFHQWVYSAASGGPWASPLILEPQGFFDQVHTHMVMPMVVGLYKVFPSLNTLLVVHSFFAAVTLWPAYRLAERIGGIRYALLFCVALMCFGPFQAVAVADFRPMVLFLPGIVGVWAAAHRGLLLQALAWGSLALMGRQDACYLLLSSGFVLCISSWGRCTRTVGIGVLSLGTLSFLAFAFVKPEMFFHINLTGQTDWPQSAELWSNRGGFGIALLVSGWWIGLRKPAPWIAVLPVVWGMLSTHREWHLLEGPGAHHHAFWLPFVIAAGAIGASSIPKRMGPILLAIMGWLSFPHPQIQVESSPLQGLVELIPSQAAVGADYDSIHKVSGRTTLWNVDQFHMSDRPRHWQDAWPLTEDDVDYILAHKDHSIQTRVMHWEVVAETSTHQLRKSP